jgi:hypothetical protein
MGAQALDDGREVLVALRHLAECGVISLHFGVAEAHLQ